MSLTALKKQGANLKALELNDKMRRFSLEFPLDHDGTKAAIRAGYSRKSAARQAHKLLQNPIIQAIIGKAEREDVERLELDREEVLWQLWYALTREAKDFVDKDGFILPIHQMSDRAQAVIDGFDQTVVIDKKGRKIQRTKLKLTTKIAAIEMAMKHKGLFAAEKHEVSVGPRVDFDDLTRARPQFDEVDQRLRLEEQKDE